MMPRLLQKEDLSLLVDGSYLYRWWLLSLPGAQRLYLHHYVGSDWSRDEHCHPKWFLSIGLWGGYVECSKGVLRQYRAPWIRVFKATHRHRLRVSRAGCWTLCLTGREKRPWGFHTGKGWMEWKDYIEQEAQGSLVPCTSTLPWN